LEEFLFVTYNLGYKDLLAKGYAPFGVVPLGFLDAPHTILSKQPLNNLTDLKGVKIRAHGTYAELMNSLGAAATYVPMGEIYTAISTGVVSAAQSAYSVLAGNKIHEVTKYYQDPPYTWGCSPYYVSQKALNALPDDLKNVVMMSGLYEFTLWSNNLAMQTEIYVGAIKTFEKAGLKKCTIPEKEWREVALPIAQKITAKAAGQNPLCLEMLSILDKFYSNREAGTFGAW